MVIYFDIYGDPAYPQLRNILGGFHNPEEGSLEVEWNTRMSSIREVVEWGYKEIVN